MQHQSRDTVTVSPPTFDRTDFARVDAALAARHAPFNRSWLMGRFAEGLQIRLLKSPEMGLVLFQPGKLAWRPILGADRALVVQDLRVGAGPLARDSAARLWSVADRFARYYGLSAVLALVGSGAGLISGDLAPGRGWLTLDQGPGGTRLIGRILQGPMALPRLPTDWDRRAAALGPGVVVQTTGESALLDIRARAIIASLVAQGCAARHDRLTDAAAAQARAVRPGAAFSVVIDGCVAGGVDLSASAILDRTARPRP